MLPKHWWEGTDANGKQARHRHNDARAAARQRGLSHQGIPPGRTIVYERVKDYWGENLNVNVGRENFDELRYEYFRDATVALEAFKGDAVDWRTENSAKNWATAYDFPAVKDGRVVLEEFPIRNVGNMQAFVFNIRRDKFKDPRVRRAFNLAFDFEEMNKQIFFGQYKRIASYFEGTELAAAGLPQGPRTRDSAKGARQGAGRGFHHALQQSGRRQSGSGAAQSAPGGAAAARRRATRSATTSSSTARPASRRRVEFLAEDPNFERVFLFYKPSLDRLGIGVTVRTVDEAQYENRLRSWDFDIITNAWRQSLSPGNEQRELLGLAGRRSARLSQPHRHQESGGRCHDR